MIYDWARKQAEREPESIAVTLENRHITYGVLESESNRLACQLLKSGFTPGGRVGLLLDKTPETLIAMHGISKAGGIYVPLNINSPAERLTRILNSAEISFLMVDHASLSKYKRIIKKNESFREIPWVWWSKDPRFTLYQPRPTFSYHDIEDQPDYPFQKIRDDDYPAQILFTSGSDGRPKGVVTTHHNIKSFIQWAVPYFEIQSGDRLSGYSSLFFDRSIFDIYGSMAAGAHLYLIPDRMNSLPGKLADFILENDLTQWFSVPSVMSSMARCDVVEKDDFPGLKRLIWSGAEFPVTALRYWMEKLPHVSFTNLYGRTEATIASSYYTIPEIPDSETEIPIGTSCDGEKMLILNDEQNPVEEGETGDLYISGSGLSLGYWKDKKATAAAFTWRLNSKGRYEYIHKTGDKASREADGFIYYRGRSDNQIISRGYRIELGEVEAALGHINTLREYAVVPVRKEGFEGTAIGCAYVSSGPENGEMPLLLKQNLVKKVPGYMMPHYWASYDKLPRSKNGEIDRRILSKAFE